MKYKRSWLYLVLAALVLVSLVAGVEPFDPWPHWRLHDESLHSAVEAMGALAAVVMAAFLLLRDEEGTCRKYFMFALGFLGMGAFDLFHALSRPGAGFVFLHSIAGLAGGFFFSLAWLPWGCLKDRLRKRLPWAVVSVCVFFGLWVLLFPETLPAMVTDGEFSAQAKGINIAAGTLLVIAAARQLADFHRLGDVESYLFACLLLMFGLAALMFSNSMLWDDVWWVWHLERLAAYALALWWVIKKHKGLVRELRAALAERKRAEEERTTLYHMLTHDIKGPLTLIYGYSEILGEQLAPSSGEMVGEIKKAARRISALIDDMLTLSSVESPGFRLKLSPIRLEEILDQAVTESKVPASEIDVRLDLSVEGLPPVFMGDRMQLMRAFGNLVSNAVKYNRHGGTVSVRAWVDGDAPGQVMVEVSDTGVGINGADIPHVFERYYRGGRTGVARGTGLGLAVVKAVVLAHGGTVTAASGENGGSTFTVALPVSPT